MASRSRWLRYLERILLLVGVILLTIYAVARLHSQISSRLAVERFKAAQLVNPRNAPNSVSERTGEEVDFGLWSEKRVQEYKESLLTKKDAPLAVLRIPQIHLEVPVFDGTDELTLNRGVGRIVGTSRPGQAGNVGIAGHRDGFFRVLKDIAVGERVDLLTPNRTDAYVVDKVVIVNPEDVHVLESTSVPSLTLVTCYPFYFIGSAPQRYIVHASIADADHPKDGPGDQSQAEVTKTNQKAREN